MGYLVGHTRPFIANLPASPVLPQDNNEGFVTLQPIRPKPIFGIFPIRGPHVCFIFFVARCVVIGRWCLEWTRALLDAFETW